MRAGHALVRKPRNLRIKGGTANVVGCECGAVGMAPTVMQRMAWHAEHVRGLPEEAVVRHQKVQENQRILAELQDRLKSLVEV